MHTCGHTVVPTTAASSFILGYKFLSQQECESVSRRGLGQRASATSLTIPLTMRLRTRAKKLECVCNHTAALATRIKRMHQYTYIICSSTVMICLPSEERVMCVVFAGRIGSNLRSSSYSRRTVSETTDAGHGWWLLLFSILTN